MWLPVMDNKNKAMKLSPYNYQVWDSYKKQYVEKSVAAATMFDVNKTIMRCLVKNLAMFGLGLYIYAGEDLPENTANSEDPTVTSSSAAPASAKAEVKPNTTRRGRTAQQPTQPANDRYASIKAAIAAMQDTESLLALYNQHKNEVEGNEAIKALFTLRKYELQQAS